MTVIRNGFVRLKTETLSPQHGADVSPIIFATHVYTPIDGLKIDQVFVKCFSGEDWC